jgi:hypothetical protein
MSADDLSCQHTDRAVEACRRERGLARGDLMLPRAAHRSHTAGARDRHHVNRTCPSFLVRLANRVTERAPGGSGRGGARALTLSSPLLDMVADGGGGPHGPPMARRRMPTIATSLAGEGYFDPISKQDDGNALAGPLTIPQPSFDTLADGRKGPRDPFRRCGGFPPWSQLWRREVNEWLRPFHGVLPGDDLPGSCQQEMSDVAPPGGGASAQGRSPPLRFGAVKER